jgi:hypothetical protein
MTADVGIERLVFMPGSGLLDRAAAPLQAGAPSVLLTVIAQHLGAGLAERGAVLLEARQDHLIAVIHLGSAMPRDVAGTTGILPRRSVLRGCRGCCEQQSNDKKSGHRVGHSKPDREYPIRIPRCRMATDDPDIARKVGQIATGLSTRRGSGCSVVATSASVFAKGGMTDFGIVILLWFTFQA